MFSLSNEPLLHEGTVKSPSYKNVSEENIMSRIIVTVLLLIISNTFMTFAWYAHLRHLSGKPWLIAALVSWSIALFEYLFQVPANRIGYATLSLSQLKIIQEVITLCVFVPFAVFYMRQSWSWNYLWAGLCLMGAVFFIFRDSGKPKTEPETPPYAVRCTKTDDVTGGI